MLPAMCLLADCLFPELSLFLEPAVKGYLVVCCASVIVGSGALLSRYRGQLRRKLERARKRARLKRG